MFALESTPGRTCVIDGKEYLFFSGYSYLGMNNVKAFTDLVKEGMKKYGLLFPSSRISNTRLALYEEFENNLSQLTGFEDTVSFSSGYLAGRTMAEILSSYKNVFVAPHSHPAITIYKNDQGSQALHEWQDEVTARINLSDEKEFVLVSDSVNILECVVNSFSFLENIKPGKKITFLVDDSHGIGILNNGKGIISSLPQKENVEFIISYSLSKAFNIEGGAVSCSKKFAGLLRHHPNYAGSTAINPSLVYAFMKSDELYATQREKLFDNISYVKNNLRKPLSLKNAFNLPVFICQNENAENSFHENGLIISSFSYPTPESKKVNRVVINALHTQEDLDKLITAANR